MKVAAVCVFIACGISTISSQPTYEFDQDRDCTCQRLERGVYKLLEKVDAIEQEVIKKSLEKEQDVTVPPSISPRPAGESRKVSLLTYFVRPHPYVADNGATYGLMHSMLFVFHTFHCPANSTSSLTKSIRLFFCLLCFLLL